MRGSPLTTSFLVSSHLDPSTSALLLYALRFACLPCLACSCFLLRSWVVADRPRAMDLGYATLLQMLEGKRYVADRPTNIPTKEGMVWRDGHCRGCVRADFD